jgi:hypothetical protein
MKWLILFHGILFLIYGDTIFSFFSEDIPGVLVMLSLFPAYLPFFMFILFCCYSVPLSYRKLSLKGFLVDHAHLSEAILPRDRLHIRMSFTGAIGFSIWEISSHPVREQALDHCAMHRAGRSGVSRLSAHIQPLSPWLVHLVLGLNCAPLPQIPMLKCSSPGPEHTICKIRGF